MVSGRAAGMRTGCGWTGMSGVVRQVGDRTHGSCCGGSHELGRVVPEPSDLADADTANATRAGNI